MTFFTDGGFRFFRSADYENGISNLNGRNYFFSIGLGMDTASFHPGCRFEFSDRPLGHDLNVINNDEIIWDGAALFDLAKHSRVYEPYCICRFRDLMIPEEEESYYVSIDGWIELGLFEESYGGGGTNIELIKFECIAVNCNGDTLRVENGYLGKYAVF